jgi:DNA-binding SARP family transcriptional activator
VLVVGTGLSQNGGSLLAYVVSRLRPDVFSHPIWVHFGEKERPASSEAVEELLSAATQLQKDDPGSACQILLICAVHQNYAGQRDEALKTMQWILALAEQYDLADELVWAPWGACAICLQAGETEGAAGYLERLQSRLRERDEWVLANFVETIAHSLSRQGAATKVGENELPQDQTTRDLICLTFDWLQEWGFSARLTIPEFQVISHSTNGSGQEGIASLQPFSSDGGWGGYWRVIKQIVRGELKLRWVANGTAHQASSKVQGHILDSPPLKVNRPESAPSPVDQTSLRDRPRIEPATSSHASSPPEKLSTKASLLVYYLGSFRVYKDDQLVEKWPGNKCKQILKYMVVHRNVPVNQEVLMELFWPGMDSKGARRNLYQAIYNLRQALQNSGEEYPYVLTEGNSYSLNSEIELWVDSEAFDLHYQNAQNLIASGRQDEAMREFQMAEDLYLGEFLAEDRYEDWPLVHRENLKNAYLDALDQLSQYFYAKGQFATCIYYCRKILAEDNCREDAHRRVMLCHINLGQPHLALRQYHTCVEALRDELDVPPMPATEELYKQIRRKQRK